MLNCRACLWRCIQALEASHTNVQSLHHNAAPSLLFRNFMQTSTPTLRDGSQLSELSKADDAYRSGSEKWRESAQFAGLKKKEFKALTRNNIASRQTSVDASRKLGQCDPTVSAKDWNQRKKELQYLTDPLELANFVKRQLRKDKVMEMLQLVRMASHSMQCIVSWNHIIDHLLYKEKVAQALKVYNDMKKRAQFPDSYTYTILLRGLSANAHHSGSLEKALSVYHSLSAPNSRVQPSIIHTNAILKVCARANDMDALWGVVAKIPGTGPAAANGITYATILNAIRQSLLVGRPIGETGEQEAIRRERGVIEGRRIWEEVIIKWRNTDIVIKEELVCSMGRLLLIGSRPRDWDDVLSLVEQTMDIPRSVPRLGTPERLKAGLPPLRAPKVLEEFRYDDDHLSPEKAPMRGEEFLPIADPGIDGAVSNPLGYAKPSNNTLSLILEACQKVAAPQAADKYWDLLIDPVTYGIVPDLNSLTFRLRLLRQNRSSAKTVEMLKTYLVNGGLEPRPGIFRIAMSTCNRDKNNHNSLNHATQILDIMSATLEDADARVIAKYAELAIDFPLATGRDYMDALAHLQPVAENLRIQLGIGAGKYPDLSPLDGSDRQHALLALRKIFGLYDKLINSELVSEEEKRPYKEQRARMAHYLHRLNYQDHRRGRDVFDKKAYRVKKLVLERRGEEGKA
ncbi:pentatricopeptide repeat protein-like protein [Lojkania enalia]|uniref:Pentatricopeptide repeat protein-like protein n=1 Tax=Lojkania enalia TaxID=147567 RepID=A0A9P4MZH7_9PLEO|nr:pentatricopeptide repeat protein-like protein [Didymosphaeria enalia]